MSRKMNKSISKESVEVYRSPYIEKFLAAEDKIVDPKADRTEANRKTMEFFKKKQAEQSLRSKK